MYREERFQLILKYLEENKRISVEEVCSLCNISRDTARRDIVKLEERGSILRTRGGALLPSLGKEIGNYKDRLFDYSSEKKSIGKLAASLINDGDRIIMDTSTTVQSCIEFLDVENCDIITNSINLADMLSNIEGVNINLLGGKLNKEHRFLYGGSLISMLSNYYAQKLFIGTSGITKNGVMTLFEEDGFVKRKMIEQSDQVILLADRSKLGKSGFFKYADLSQIDIIITDALPDKDLLEVLKGFEIEIMISGQ